VSRAATLAPGPLPTSEQLQPQELLVTILGTYVRPFGDRVWSGGLVVLLGELGFSEGAARVALTRLVRRGLIVRMREGRLIHYRLTPRADRLLREGDRRIFAFGDSRDDGDTWTVLLYRLPEDRRLRRSGLARRLRFLGFGSVQDSVWVSPHDLTREVAELLDELQLADSATLFVAGVRAMRGLPMLVSRAWDLSGLVDRYEAFCAEFQPVGGGVGGGEDGGVGAGRGPVGGGEDGGVGAGRGPVGGGEDGGVGADGGPVGGGEDGGVGADGGPVGGGEDAGVGAGLSDPEAFVLRTRVAHQFRGFPLLDPELPEELAPMSRARQRAVQTFHALYAGLAGASQRHFDAVCAAHEVVSAR
jgi:phenylacetic acid degradation operon negative regulatory protein